jgi:hypothetical protein
MKNNAILRDKFEADLCHMIEGHNEIVAALNNLIDVSKNENKTVVKSLYHIVIF